MKQISLSVFSCIVSLGTLLLYNIPFFSYVADNTNESAGGKLFLLASLIIIMLALNFMMAYLTDTDLAALYPDENSQYDGILFAGLRERIESSKKDKVLIILHTSTSHGPKYADKYPKTFEVFKPVAGNVEEGEKDQALLVNAYDNTIRYTDFLLDGLINTLRSMNEWKSAMIFISDHGESLGENKMFMHGLPMKLAPKVQYEIPFLVWTSDHFRKYKKTSVSQDVPVGELPAVLEQHYIFHSVLNLLSIRTEVYDEAYDIFEAEE